jgi:hypothetical protein
VFDFVLWSMHTVAADPFANQGWANGNKRH